MPSPSESLGTQTAKNLKVALFDAVSKRFLCVKLSVEALFVINLKVPVPCTSGTLLFNRNRTSKEENWVIPDS